MKLVLSGPVDGQLEQTYERIKKKYPNQRPDWLACVGDFGTWPDPAKIDRPTRRHYKQGDFAKLYISHWQAPIQTLYISGVHEDHAWLHNRYKVGNMEVLANVHWLCNGHRTAIGDMDKVVRVTGFGKTYSENTFSGNITKKSKRHYTRAEFEKACSSGPTDLLLLYEAPANEWARRVIFATRPKLIVHATREASSTYATMGIPTMALAKHDVKLISWNEDNTISSGVFV